MAVGLIQSNYMHENKKSVSDTYTFLPSKFLNHKVRLIFLWLEIFFLMYGSTCLYPSTREAEAGGSLWVRSQAGLYSEFQDSWRATEWRDPVSKTLKTNKPYQFVGRLLLGWVCTVCLRSGITAAATKTVHCDLSFLWYAIYSKKPQPLTMLAVGKWPHSWGNSQF